MVCPCSSCPAMKSVSIQTILEEDFPGDLGTYQWKQSPRFSASHKKKPQARFGKGRMDSLIDEYGVWDDKSNYSKGYLAYINPNDYLGKTIKISGPYHPLLYEGTGKYYHYIMNYHHHLLAMM